MVLQGRVTVNGCSIRDLSYQVDPKRDIVCLDNRELRVPPKVYYLFYKPRGYLTSLYDPHHRTTLEAFLKKIPCRVFPVGRLDKESEGLILLTNDGDLANLLLHPRYEIKRTYHVWVEPKLKEDKIQELLTKGMNLEGKIVKPLKFDLIKSFQGQYVYEVVVKEGVKREVRKMVSYLGGKVLKLIRVAFGPLKIKGLKPGQIRSLTPFEIKTLKTFVQQRSSKILAKASLVVST